MPQSSRRPPDEASDTATACRWPSFEQLRRAHAEIGRTLDLVCLEA
jgi:hypothetical protein